MSNDPRTRKGAKPAGTDRKTYCPHVLTALVSLPKYRMTCCLQHLLSGKVPSKNTILLRGRFWRVARENGRESICST